MSPIVRTSFSNFVLSESELKGSRIVVPRGAANETVSALKCGVDLGQK
jgi:hypothetical protein